MNKLAARTAAAGLALTITLAILTGIDVLASMEPGDARLAAKASAPALATASTPAPGI